MDISTKSGRSTGTRRQQIQLPDVMGLGGAIAGLGAGVIMAIIGAIISGMYSGDIWLEVKQIAAPLFAGFDPAQPGFAAGPVITGTLVHLFISAALGATFSIVTRRILKLPSDMGVPVLSGLIYGFALWLIAYFVVLPVINPLLLDMYQPAFIAQSLVYGIALGLLYGLLRPFPYDDYALRHLFLRLRDQE